MYFTNVAVTGDDFAILGGHLYSEGQEPTVTRFVLLDKGQGFFLFDFDDLVYAIDRKPMPAGKPRDSLCIMGRAGKYRENVAGGKPVDTRIDLNDEGFFLDLRYIGKHLYACGHQNIVYRQNGTRWVRADQGAFKRRKMAVDRSFDAIHGFSEDDIYAVGLGGAIWHWNGEKWKELESPTNFGLYAILCSSGGDVYIAGGGGLVFKGGRKGWTDLSDRTVMDDTIWNMAEFQGKIYLAAYDKLLVTDGGPVQEMKVPLLGKKSFMAMDATPRQLWTVGDDNIFQFDGKKWNRHVLPDNV
jgi:hypothetical protein